MRDLTSATAQIVAAQAASGSRTTAEILDLIRQVHAALVAVDASPDAAIEALRASAPAVETDAAATPVDAAEGALSPAVAVEKSITHERLVCLEDGDQVILLARHLKNKHHMTPDQYRLRWGLAHDYPMVAAAYVEVKRRMAISGGLGQTVRPPARVAKPTPIEADKTGRRRLKPAFKQPIKQPELSVHEAREPQLID